MFLLNHSGIEIHAKSRGSRARGGRFLLNHSGIEIPEMPGGEVAPETFLLNHSGIEISSNISTRSGKGGVSTKP